MRQLMVAMVLLLLSGSTCVAQTYRWTDSKGVKHFTDSLESVPARYRAKMKVSSDITTRDPRVQEELRQQEQRAQQENSSTPRITPTPDYVPPQPATKSVELTEPPPRTKSQKIRDNIERRKQEEEKTRPGGNILP